MHILLKKKKEKKNRSGTPTLFRFHVVVWLLFLALFYFSGGVALPIYQLVAGINSKHLLAWENASCGFLLL